MCFPQPAGQVLSEDLTQKPQLSTCRCVSLAHFPVKFSPNFLWERTALTASAIFLGGRIGERVPALAAIDRGSRSYIKPTHNLRPRRTNTWRIFSAVSCSDIASSWHTNFSPRSSIFAGCRLVHAEYRR